MAAKTSSESKTNKNESTSREHESSRRAGVGRGWHGDPEGHAAAGRKGGMKVSHNKDHMAAIGRKGGEAVSRDRQHMAEIGRKGGMARGSATGEKGDSDRGSNK